MAKQKGSAFSLEEATRDLGLQEADWRTFVQNTFRDYRAELGNQDTLSNPDEVRFVQLALNRTLGTAIEVDGYWGPTTWEKLVDFQKRFGLDPDGIPRPKTLAELRRQNALTQLKSIETAR